MLGLKPPVRFGRKVLFMDHVTNAVYDIGVLGIRMLELLFIMFLQTKFAVFVLRQVPCACLRSTYVSVGCGKISRNPGKS